MTGFKNKKNIYICKSCGHGFVSKYIDDGVTPFMTKCLNCDGSAVSMLHRISQSTLAKVTPAVNWCRPPKKEWGKLNAAAQAHLEKGGLLRTDQDYSK